MKNKTLERITKWSFLGLALIPLLKENLNSILIIICALLTLVYNIQSKEKKKITPQLWVMTLPFWMFLLHELVSVDNNFERVLMYLPFLIFPLLFAFKPSYINNKLKIKSLVVFQISVLFQCFIYVVFFLVNNPISKLFYVQNSIPFFREYVSENYFFEIHPTYFSSFLLASFTISFFRLIKNKKKIFAIINMAVMAFFVLLFSSRIIILLLLLTIVFGLIYLIFQKGLKHVRLILISIIALITLLVYPTRNVIGERFNEIKTEISKPIVGDYYNSTNTRMAILKCSFIVIKEVPFFGYGNLLQEKLNDCYKENNKSNFYLKHTFNTHNYYINLAAYGGWIFLLLFIAYLFYVYKKIKYSALALFMFSQFLLINVTENYFSRHYGIVLFVYVTSIFIFIKERETE